MAACASNEDEDALLWGLAEIARLRAELDLVTTELDLVTELLIDREAAIARLVLKEPEFMAKIARALEGKK
jgi:hypothetical protein